MGADASIGSVGERISRLLREYAPDPPAPGALPWALTLRGDLGLESLTLVSVALRLGEELGVDLVEAGVDLSGVETVGDFVALGQKLDAARHPG
jgi:acyl carrier protein